MESHVQTPIAIIGMGCRFPGDITDPEKLWKLLAEGQSAWTNVPISRYNESAFYHPNPDSRESHNHRGGHFLNQDIAAFDAAFFGISRAEAEAMDPQHRILLETTYEAFESGGVTLESIHGSKTAVYMALFTRDYDRNIYKDTSDIPKYQMTGNGDAILSNRISYQFDLKGPSMTLDTGCSGSMVALHLACLTLRTRESDMALAGGANLMLTPDQMIGMSNIHMLNDEGRSFSFDSRGSGYGRGEGVGAIVLKRLDDALLANNPIRAIIRGTALNQDGKTSGITLPSRQAQEELERLVCSNAGLDPREIGYIEAHGTGTVAGDVIELQALSEVYCQRRESAIFVGSVKSNIGHLEASSGLASLIKGVMMLEKKEIPPNANFGSPKKKLDLNKLKIRIPQELMTWQGTGVRRIAINSFGYGGTNAHVVLEQAPTSRGGLQPYKEENSFQKKSESNEETRSLPPLEKVSPLLFLLSATSKMSLLESVRNLKKWTSSYHNHHYLEDLSYTLLAHRSIMRWRYSFVAYKHHDVLGALDEAMAERGAKKAVSNIQIGFLFTGQGAQWWAMGRELVFTCSKFQDSLVRSQSILQDFGTSWSLIDELLRSESESQIDKTEFSQPVCTALQIALVDLLKSMGLHPQVVIGHSSGEISAAYAAGILSQEVALAVSYHRSFVSEICRKKGLANGAMLAVGLGEDEVSQVLAETGQQETVSIACVNSPVNTTVSGDEAEILKLKEVFESRSTFCQRLRVRTAYHSKYMQQVSDDYLQSIGKIVSGIPIESIRFISSVTGKEKLSQFGPSYWRDNLISKVRYCEAVQEYVCRQGDISQPKKARSEHLLIEIGPHSVLSGPTRQSIERYSRSFRYIYLSTLIKSTNAIYSIMNLASKLFEHGQPVNSGVIQSLSLSKSNPTVISNLSPYSWDHSNTYWHEPRLSRDYRLRQHPSHDLLGTRIVGSTTLEPRWRHFISIERLPWLDGHVVDGLVTFPGAGYICMVIEAMKQLAQQPLENSSRFALRDIYFSKALIIPPKPGKIEMQLSLSSPSRIQSAAKWYHFRIMSLSQNGVWNEHCYGSVTIEPSLLKEQTQKSRYKSYDARTREISSNLEGGCSQKLKSKNIYQRLCSSGNSFDHPFATISEMQMNDYQAKAEVVIPDVASTMPSNFMQSHVIHPTTLDAVLHSSLPVYARHYCQGSIVPMSISYLNVSTGLDSTPGKSLLVYTELTVDEPRKAQADILVYPLGGSLNLGPVIIVSKMELRGLGETSISRAATSEIRNISYDLKWNVDADFLSPTLLNPTFRSPNQNFKTSREQRLDLLNKAASVYIDHCLKQVTQKSLKISLKHFSELFEWMKRYKTFSCYQISSMTSSLSSDNAVKESCFQGVDGEMLDRVGGKLTQILTGEVEPLQLMLNNDLLYRVYAESSFIKFEEPMVKYVKHLCFKNPHMRILEIGAGTGGTAVPLLRALSSQNRSNFKQYDFTDVSSGFFSRARNLLLKWIDRIQFRRLDIEQDPAEQGFVNESYDLVVASNVLHATKTIEQTLANVFKLLKPSGRLILIEITQPQPFLNVIFGTLPGWWKGINDGRKDHPTLSTDQWHRALLRGSFDVEHTIHDIESIAQVSSVIISKAVENSRRPSAPPLRIIVNQNVEEPINKFVERLSLEFEKNSLQTSCVTWDQESFQKEVVYVVLDTGPKPMSASLTSERFQQIASLVMQESRVFWISAHQEPLLITNPEKGLFVGLARSAKAENENLDLTLFDVRQSLTDCQLPLIQSITNILIQSFYSLSENKSPKEGEYVYRGNQVLIPRLLPNNRLNTSILRDSGKSESMPNEGIEHGDLLDSEIQKINSSEQLSVADLGRPLCLLGESNLEIETKAWGLSNANIKAANEQSETSVILRECAGIIKAVGSQCTEFKPGDRVCAWGKFLYSRQAVVNVDSVCRLPDSISFPLGASIPVAFTTAHYSLINRAGLRKGQTILVHAASSDVGQAALQISKHVGALTLATVSTATEKRLLVSRLNLLEDSIIVTDDGSLEDQMVELTKGKEVDVVLNLSPENNLRSICACLVSLGTFVQIGGLKTNHRDERSTIDTLLLGKCASFFSFDFAMLSRAQPHKLASLVANAIAMLETNLAALSPTFELISSTDVERGFRWAKDKTRKQVLIVEEKPDIQPTDESHRTFQLHENATYVIAGGLGDIGRRLCCLMAKGGATHLVVLSPWKLEVSEKRDIEKELYLIAPGCKLYVKLCDIADRQELEQTVSSFIAIDLPPVRGIVQATGVQEDCTLKKMTLGNFQVSLQEKLHGTCNLSEIFRSPSLDFFVLLSSTTAIIGNSSQASCAAANSFQDYITNSQAELETHYVSLSIGLIEGTGANNEKQEQHSQRQGLIPIHPRELLVALEYSMSVGPKQDHCNQVVLGFNEQSISQVQSKNDNTKTAMFSHVWQAIETDSSQNSQTENAQREEAPKPLNESILDSKNLEEMQKILAAAILSKLSTLVTFADRDVNLSLSLDELGMDSLVALDLKEWIAKECLAKVQPFDILDQANVMELAVLVATRSSIVKETLQRHSGQDNVTPTDHSKATNMPSLKTQTSQRDATHAQLTPPAQDSRSNLAIEQAPSSIEPLSNTSDTIGEPKDLLQEFSAQLDRSNALDAPDLPRLPLPDLNRTMRLYLSSVRALCSDKEFSYTTSLTEKSCFQGSPESLAHQHLVQKASHSDNWLVDLYTSSIHLNSRFPLQPFDTFFGSHLLSSVPHTQAQRAAVISAEAFQFKQALESGRLERETLNEQPLCMDLLKWQFNATREPHTRSDKMRRYPGNDYLIALRKGHVFKVMLTEEGKNVTCLRLEACFEEILMKTNEDVASLCTLTGDERDSWTEIRNKVKSASAANDALIRTVEASAFVMCLDDASPTTSQERYFQFMLSGGTFSNRWADKPLQFVVCSNGLSAYLAEHAMLDGTTIKAINKSITRAILDYRPPTNSRLTHQDSATSSSPPPLPLEELPCTSNPSLHAEISRVQENFRLSTRSIVGISYVYTRFGNAFLRSFKCPPKTGFQLILQLAALQYFGHHPPSWETASLRAFHKGRVEICQTVTVPVARFCTAARDHTVPAATRRTLFFEAARAHANMITRASRGQGADRHLTALKEIMAQGKEGGEEQMPALFTDPVYVRTRPGIMMTDCMETHSLEVGSAMGEQEKDALWIHYEVEADRCRFSIVGTSDRTKAFIEALEEAGETVRSFLIEGE